MVRIRTTTSDPDPHSEDWTWRARVRNWLKINILFFLHLLRFTSSLWKIRTVPVSVKIFLFLVFTPWIWIQIWNRIQIEIDSDLDPHCNVCGSFTLNTAVQTLSVLRSCHFLGGSGIKAEPSYKGGSGYWLRPTKKSSPVPKLMYTGTLNWSRRWTGSRWGCYCCCCRYGHDVGSGCGHHAPSWNRIFSLVVVAQLLSSRPENHTRLKAFFFSFIKMCFNC